MSATADQELVELRRANAELLRERDAALAALARRNTEYGERIEYQAATIDVLKAMSASPGDPQPVFDLIAVRARDLCDAYGLTVLEFDGTLIYQRAATGVSDDPRIREASAARFPRPATRDSPAGRAILERQTIRIDDLEAEPDLHPVLRRQTAKSAVTVPLLRGAAAIGALSLGSRERGGFTDSQIELLQTFAEQAVIAISSAETYRALQTRTADLQQALEYQTATSDVLAVISRSTFDLQPVLDTVAETAARLCDAQQAAIYQRECELVRLVSSFGFPPEYVSNARSLGAFPIERSPKNVGPRAIREGRTIHIHDVATVPGYGEASIRLGRQRTSLGVPLMREGEAIGSIVLARQRVEPFTERQIELVSTFANQAVIAIENTRLLTEQREALEQQTATAEVLQVINASPGELGPVFETLLDRAMRLCGAKFGELQVFDGERLRQAAFLGVPHTLAEFRRNSMTIPTPGPTTRRMRDGATVIHTADLMAESPYREGDPHRRALVDLGGARTVLAVALRKDDQLLGAINIYRQEVNPFNERQIALLQSFAAQAVIAMENARLLSELRTARDAAEASLRELKAAQASLIQAEKMASLGQLTAGIAHEIKNPLNFVNNFASLSVDLLDELKQTAAPGLALLDDARRTEVDDLASTLASNLSKITEHGRRADGIVRGMLEHSRGSSGERRQVDLNALVEEALNLAYHGARAQDQGFNVTLQREFGQGIAPVTLAPQDVTRVLLNLCSNGFYAARERQRMEAMPGFEPTLQVSTREIDDAVEIRVRDNGTGIPSEIKDRLFQPFFTTKPPGEGTSLGLSMSYEIITQQHGGSITVGSKVGEYSEFTIRLPRRT